MKEKLYKYAEVLLENGLCIKKKQPLLINAPISSIEFVRILTEVACEKGVEDIYYDWTDGEIKHTTLKYIKKENIKKSQFWNKTIHDEYAKKNAAFLFLTSSGKDIMSDIDAIKIKTAANNSLKTRKLYLKMQEDNEVSWCIAAVATKEWAELLFGYLDNPLEKLWEIIFDICLVNEEDPCNSWKIKMQENKKMCNKLTKLKIKSLHYKNSLGTDLTISLSDKAIWCGGSSNINKKNLIVNIPTEEVFTTPNTYLTNGIVYTSIPLVNSGVIIKDIYLEFKEGKVVKYHASSGEAELKNILETDSYSNMLGEVALVDIKSKISETGILFYDTLYDENASCHIALGRGFKECLTNGNNMKEAELKKQGYNQSNNHVDIMIGTKDLCITANTYDGKNIEIFKNGSFII